MIRKLSQLDRRWVFLLMLLAVAIPLLAGFGAPEKPSPNTRLVFDAMEALPEGSRVFVSMDYDPSSKGELHPMSEVFTRHAGQKKFKIYFMTLWPQGAPLIGACENILQQEFPDRKYGEDYVNLGYQPGGEVVMKVLTTDFPQQFLTGDKNGTPLASLELTRNIKTLRQMNMLVSVGAGNPGTQEWVQYAASQHEIPMVGGTTGVSTPGLLAYVPGQMKGVLGGVKGAAEYEQLLFEKYPELEQSGKLSKRNGMRLMGPQLMAHLLMVCLIFAGNAIYFIQRRQEVRR